MTCIVCMTLVTTVLHVHPFLSFLCHLGVIMAPTRELAMQIYKECRKFSKPLGLQVVCVYGGTGISEQVTWHYTDDMFTEIDSSFLLARSIS